MLRNGSLTANDVPVGYINGGGVKLIENTRSSLALMRAGIPELDWNLINLTGNEMMEAKIAERLARNGLTNFGTDVLRITGAGKYGSSLR